MAGQRQNTERHHHCVLLEAARESPCTYQVSITILDRITLHGHRFGFKPFCHAKKEATAAKLSLEKIVVNFYFQGEFSKLESQSVLSTRHGCIGSTPLLPQMPNAAVALMNI